MDLLQIQPCEEPSQRVAPVPRVLLTESDTRIALGNISRSKLHDLVHSGELRAVKLGSGLRSGIRFRVEDLREFAARHLNENQGR